MFPPQDCLGYDRHGRKYWFLCRRIFVEEISSSSSTKTDDDSSSTPATDSSSSGQVWYYSTPYQLELLLASLDRIEYEKDLCREIANLRPEMVRQMTITMNLTNELKGKSLRSILARMSRHSRPYVTC